MTPDTFMNVTTIVLAIIAIYRRAWRSVSGLAFSVGIIVTATTSLQIHVIPSLLLPPWFGIALRETTPALHTGPPSWSSKAKGFEVTDLNVFSKGRLVESVSLMRIDPAFYRFSVHFSKDEPLLADQWREKLNAVAVVNGSYYGLNREPDTPILASGKRFGPAQYISQHGMFLADDPPRIIDLLDLDVNQVTQGVTNAMVSYPLLIDEKGRERAGGRPEWLANRTFVGLDRNGRVVLGTTERGFFSLRAFGSFLKEAPLNLKTALNFDGGPVACQSIKVGDLHRVLYGGWEFRHHSTYARVLFQGALNHRHGLYTRPDWKLPIVLAVQRR